MAASWFRSPLSPLTAQETSRWFRSRALCSCWVQGLRVLELCCGERFCFAHLPNLVCRRGARRCCASTKTSARPQSSADVAFRVIAHATLLRGALDISAFQLL